MSAVTAKGRQLVLWAQDDGTLSGSQVWSRIVDPNGAPVGDPLLVADGYHPAIAARGRREEFLVAWSDLPYSDSGSSGPRVVAQWFDANGAPLGEDFIIAASGQDPVLVYGGKRKEFVVVWQEFTTGVTRIYGARLAGGESSASEPVLISRNGPAGADYYSPDVASDSRTGGYLVTWGRFGGGTSKRSFVRVLPADPDKPLGRQRAVTKTSSGYSRSPQVTYNRSAREYLALWLTDRWVVRRIHAGGRPYGRQVTLDRGLRFAGFVGDIAAAPDGHYEVLLSGDEDPDVSPGEAVFVRRLGAELKLGARLRRVSSSDRTTAASPAALVYSRASKRFRAVWIQGRERNGDPDRDVWTRGL